MIVARNKQRLAEALSYASVSNFESYLDAAIMSGIY